ncbi:hypothetical protein TNCT_287301 [Trichonephila clavata]|uniref:Uncharacterized protein n=1 Tax=Trichonephila clavata TaxID=2740835 RepID=A0A8X6KN21_TRICU|nr:hypothetical protein TNCT_287301 [Trichonephila clavata]
MACAGLLENEIHGGREKGGGKKYFSLYCSLKLYGRQREVSRTALSYGSLCCSSDSLKYSWTVLNHCFVVWMDAFSAQRSYPAIHGQFGGIVLLSKETCTVGKPIPLCPGDLKLHCYPEKVLCCPVTD